MRKEDNQLGRVWLLMLFTLLYCLGAYFLPGRIAGHTMEAIGLAGRFQAATGIGEFDGFLAAAVGKGGYPRS